MKKILAVAFTTLLLLSAKSTFAASTNFDADSAKANITLGTSDVVNVVVESIELPTEFTYRKAYMWGGDDTTPPKTIIKAITISSKGESIFIPLSAYSDLGNPRKISLSKLAVRGFRLLIIGGDAAGSYQAMLDFKANEISRRRVVSGEFPIEVWEETTYSFNHLNNYPV